MVTLDDGRKVPVPAEVVERLRVAPGALLTDDQVAELEVKSALFRAREAALRLLAVRARASAELETRLLRLGFARATVHQVASDLRAQGYLDDVAFAIEWARTRLQERGYGLARVRWELSRKGLPPAVVEEALRTVAGEDPGAEEERRARAFVLRRAGQYRNLPDRTRLRRLAGLLERRGFSTGTILRVLRPRGEEA